MPNCDEYSVPLSLIKASPSFIDDSVDSRNSEKIQNGALLLRLEFLKSEAALKSGSIK